MVARRLFNEVQLPRFYERNLVLPDSYEVQPPDFTNGTMCFSHQKNKMALYSIIVAKKIALLKKSDLGFLKKFPKKGVLKKVARKKFKSVFCLRRPLHG